MKSICYSHKFFLLAAHLLLLSIFVTSCNSLPLGTATPNIPTKEITEISNTIFTELPLGPTSTIETTPTIGSSFFKNLKQSLKKGTYIVYQNQGGWRIKEITESEVQDIPEIKSALSTAVALSPDESLAAFTTGPGNITIYNLITGQVKSYINPKVDFIAKMVWMQNIKNNTLLYMGTPEEFFIPDASMNLYGLSYESNDTYAILDYIHNEKFEHFVNFSLSNDGNWLALLVPQYSAIVAPDPGYQIFLMNTSCQKKPESCFQAVRLVGDGSYVSWSPDNDLTWICEKETELCMIDKQNITDSSEYEAVNHFFSVRNKKINHFLWSPDRKNIAFSIKNPSTGNNNDSSTTISILSIEDGKVKEIEKSLSNLVIEAWSWDSRYLFYTKSNGFTSPQGNIGVMMPITEIFVFDTLAGKGFDFIASSNGPEVFGFTFSEK